MPLQIVVSTVVIVAVGLWLTIIFNDDDVVDVLAKIEALTLLVVKLVKLVDVTIL